MSAVLALMGCLSIAYGITLMRLKSGTFFYTVWCAVGATLLAAAWAVHAGMWAATPPAFKLGVTIVLVAMLGVLGIVNYFIFSQFNVSAESGLDYLIVLGAQIYKGGRPSRVLRYRLDAALAYLRDNPQTMCVVSGGQGSDEPFPEAQGMAAYLAQHGISSERIILESKSTNTVENIAFSLRLIGSANYRIGIVTNNFHVFRALRLARKAGIQQVSGIAAYSTLWNLPNNLLRESLAVIKGFVLGNL